MKLVDTADVPIGALTKDPILMLPPKTHPKWKELVCGKLKVSFTLLATKFFITRVTGRAKIDPTTENIERLIEEAYGFFKKNEKLAQKDIQAIFGQESK
ncbi:hypothetical protein [Telmatospirillum siberiense]|nr:hypothetical protein [Telmatospirillum siberiense]